MKILALEFSSDQRSVAVALNGEVRGVAGEKGARHTRAFHLIETALREAVIEREEIDVICAGLGPGSYTGIRAAIALAQGWQLARGTKTLGISSAEVLAHLAAETGWNGPVNLVIDAQRGEFYLAQYMIEAGQPRAGEPLRIASQAEVQARADAGEIIAGPEITRWFPKGRELHPDAAMLARLAAGHDIFIPAEQLTPIYLRETSFVKAPPPRVIPTG